MQKSRMAAAGGWLVALVAVAAVFVIRAKRMPRAVPEEPLERTAAAASAGRVAVSAETPSTVEDVQTQEGVMDAAAAEESGEDWTLPAEEPDSPEGIFALLRNAPAGEKALGEAIMADLTNGVSNGSLELVRKAAKCRNAKVQMLAILLLGNCIDRAGADGAANPEKAPALSAAAHDFCSSPNEMVAMASFEMFCFAGKLDGREANMRESVKSALCDWKRGDTYGSVALRMNVPGRYAYRDNYRFSFNADIGEWARMFSDVIENSPNKSSVESAREYYRELTQTNYTTREDAEAWCARRAELKAQGRLDHADDPDFDAEAWATECEDSDRAGENGGE